MSITEFIYTVILKPGPLKAAANALLKRIIPEHACIRGAIIYLNPDDPVISGALTLRVYEKDEIAFFSGYFSPDMNLVDIGANVGLYTGLALATPGCSGTILSLEPHTESRNYLHKTVKANRHPDSACRVIVSDKAVSDSDGTLKLHQNSRNKGDNRLYADDMLDLAEKIEARTLDALCAEHGINEINFLKIDVQGFEARALSGARILLGQTEDCILLSEFWPAGLRAAGSDPVSYLGMLREYGFTLFRLEQRGSVSRLDDSGAIASLSGRKYMNIVGFKGRYLDRV